MKPMKYSKPLLFIALGLFGVYTIEFGVVGILPVIIERFHITAAQAGFLVSSFALIIALFGPFMVLLMSRFNRKRIMTMSLFVFAITSLLSAYTSNFYLLVILRIIPALFHPVYFSLAFVAATALYPPEKATQASAKAFLGTSMGMVLGIPITAYIANQFSYEASFWFTAVANGLAGIGILFMLPDTPQAEMFSYRKQLGILRKVSLWLNIGAATFIFAAMFSVYSYSAEYLGQNTGMSSKVISFLLIIFGIGGMLGNLLAGKLMGLHKVRTALFHPVVLGGTYLLLYGISSSFIPTLFIIIVWGAVHTSGLIVAQIWVIDEAKEAPAFANSLYISFINLGVSLGSLAGGWFIARAGIHGTLWSGLLFAMLAMICIGSKLIYPRILRKYKGLDVQS